MKTINPKLLELITSPEFKTIQVEQNSNAELFDVICEGERHDKLVKFAGDLSRQGLSENALIEAAEH